MTNILFYTNVTDRLYFLYKLLAYKMLSRRVSSYIAVADDSEAQRMDEYLWTAEEKGFLPHEILREDVAAESPVVIGVNEPGDDFRADALVWWRSEIPGFLGRFDHLIEIVPQKGLATEQARERYKFYKSHGYQITTHKMETKN